MDVMKGELRQNGAPMNGSLRVRRMSSRTSWCCLAVALGLAAGVWSWLPLPAIGGGEALPSTKSIVDKAIAFHGGPKLGRDLALIRTEESEMMLEGDKVSLTCEWQYQ